MNKEQMKQWIDNASYKQLFEKWRFAPVGDPFFQGEIGSYYSTKMKQRRKEVGNDTHVVISKSIGWNK